MFGVAKSECLELAPQREQGGLPDVREDQVLLVRHADLAEAVRVGQIGDHVHLVRRRVARRHARFLQRQRDGGVAGNLVRKDVALDPVGERAVVGHRGAKTCVVAGQTFVRRRREERRDALDFLVRHRRRAALHPLPFGLDVAREYLERHLLDQDLDAGLVLVVAPAEAVVDAQDRVEVIEDFLARQKFADDVADHRRAAEARRRRARGSRCCPPRCGPRARRCRAPASPRDLSPSPILRS